MSGIIIDHSHTPAKRSTGNMNRLARRQRARIKEAVNAAANNGKLQDMTKDLKVRLKRLDQPTFRNNPATGTRRRVYPGNDTFAPGDTIPRPKGGGGGGNGSGNASDGDESEDDFIFEVPRELVRELLLEDLELPNLVKNQLTGIDASKREREGYAASGTPSNLAMAETARRALGRRIALKRPKRRELDALQREIDELEAKTQRDARQEAELERLHKQWTFLKRKRKVIPFMDKGDLRFRRFETKPRPITQAVMFCLMDVSASMGEHEKDLARRFYYLLYLFLSQHYSKVELVFLQHTEVAQEVDQQEFFFGKRSGGTTASTVLQLMADIIGQRYPLAEWNIYGCQSSDGDNSSYDAEYCQYLLENTLLPVVQYFAYLEVGESQRRNSPLWRAYTAIDAPNFDCDTAWERNMIYPVFRRFFESSSRRHVA